MAVNVQAIDTEIRSVVTSLQTTWADFATYCKVKIMECGVNGGIASYTINGRSVTKDLNWWKTTLELANNQAAAEAGTFVEAPIRFRSRR